MKLGRLDETTSSFFCGFWGFKLVEWSEQRGRREEILANVREKEGENVGKVRRVAEKKERASQGEMA